MVKKAVKPGLFVIIIILLHPIIMPQQAAAQSSVEQQDSNKITNLLGMEFVLINSGSFMMGSPQAEPERGRDEHQHKVTLTRPFYLQTTEVTQGQYKRVMGENPSYMSSCGDDCPVETVSWNSAQEFIKKLNEIDDLGYYRLPTEAEWEYACRAGSDTAFTNGHMVQVDCEIDPTLDKMGWYCGNSATSQQKGDYKTYKVASKSPNAWGLYDMHGNVSEWVADHYGLYPQGAVTDPTGPEKGERRVYRGGSFYYEAWNCRSANRNKDWPVRKFMQLGFRVVLERK